RVEHGAAGSDRERARGRAALARGLDRAVRRGDEAVEAPDPGAGRVREADRAPGREGRYCPHDRADGTLRPGVLRGRAAALMAARATAARASAGSRAFVPGFEPLALAFEQRLARALRERADGPARVGQALRWAALSPGKRVRPLLVLAACDAVGGPWRRALPAAVAVECVHAFSLVHDDLPAMDDDDYRRG